MLGPSGEPVDVELPELGEGVVEEGEPLVAREDRNRRRDAVERAVVGGDDRA